MADSDQTGVLLLTSLLGVLLLGVAAIIWYIEPFSSLLDLNQKINVYLGFVIGIFAIIEAISTYLQWAQSKIDNRIEDLRNEIENVYGVLLTMIGRKMSWEQSSEEEERDYIIFSEKEMRVFVDHLIKYSYLVPNKFFEGMEDSDSWTYDDKIHVPETYLDNIRDTYLAKVDEYRKLLDKPPFNWGTGS